MQSDRPSRPSATVDPTGQRSVKIVAVVQCAVALERCSGFSCARAFHNRTHGFQGYPESVMFVPFSCGGCPGRRVSRLVEHLARMAGKKDNIKKKDIRVHFTGCVANDNGHYPRCPFNNYMKAFLKQKGCCVINKGYWSEGSEKRRQSGHYRAYENCKGDF